jgi:hypothetical protein
MDSMVLPFRGGRISKEITVSLDSFMWSVTFISIKIDANLSGKKKSTKNEYRGEWIRDGPQKE